MMCLWCNRSWYCDDVSVMLTASVTTGLKESSADVHLDSDALFVKNCCAVVHCHRRLITELLQQQQLLVKAAKMYQSVSLMISN